MLTGQEVAVSVRRAGHDYGYGIEETLNCRVSGLPFWLTRPVMTTKGNWAGCVRADRQCCPQGGFGFDRRVGFAERAEKEKAWAERFRADDIPVLYIYNKVDEDGGSHADAWRMMLGATEVASVSARTGEGRYRLLSAMAEVYRPYG